ncbi:FMN-dependent NADH-azoreductase [Sphingopyxis sp. FD7]|jgi:FMN-dependent NADH-azoreductase|uniref:FMN-dependent NADH-azoreductase n=1 Tax=Sphingopyxis sp. FD7 TaxID=1914525 RepID=UPI000DC62B8C|nr:NAD(P)H-dependent oxidoreductase [Sphingopyxis sp. FD7]BBB11046.1 ACP phosphodiesterase [Sphingopyxis sp. FD7]
MIESRPTALRLLHIDSSARPGLSGRDPRGSHTRRLGARFVERWIARRPADAVIYRDVGQHPPAPVDADWVAAAFTRPEKRDAAQRARLAESDKLIDELLAADIVVVGAPMYNFGVPATLKAWLDNIVRVGVTFGFDRARGGDPYWPMLPAGKTLVTLSARGDYGYDPGGRQSDRNFVEAGLAAPLAYIGLQDHHAIAIEYDEFGDQRLADSIAAAEQAVDALVDRLLLDRRVAEPA